MNVYGEDELPVPMLKGLCAEDVGDDGTAIACGEQRGKRPDQAASCQEAAGEVSLMRAGERPCRVRCRGVAADVAPE